MHHLRNNHFSQTLFGPWAFAHPLSKLVTGQDPKRHQYRELTCRTIQMGIYAVTYYKVAQLVLPLMSSLKPEVAATRIMLHRIITALPYAGYMVGLVTGKKDTSKSHQLAFAVMLVHSMAMAYLGRPLIGLGALFAFLATPIILNRTGKSDPSPFDHLDFDKNNILHIVLQDKDTENLQQVLQALKLEPAEKRKKLLEAHNVDGYTPLHLANSAKAVQLLLESGADPNSRAANSSGETPLIHAIRKNYIEVIDPLLTVADVHLKNKWNSTALDIAVTSDNWVAFNKLLSRFPIDGSDVSGWAYYFVGCGKIDKVELLLKEGMPATQSLFYHAVHTNQPKIVKLFLDKKPEFSSNAQASELFAHAQANNHIDVVNAFLEKNPSLEKKETKIKEADKDIVEPSQMLQDNDGKFYFLLSFSISNNNLAEVKKLLSQLEKVSNRSKYFELVLNATKNGQKELLDMLLKKDSSFVNMQTSDKETPLTWAAYNLHIDCVDLLLAYKADLEMRNSSGNTALLEVVRGRIPRHDLSKIKEIVNLLLKKGANPQVKSSHDEAFLFRVLKLDLYKSVSEVKSLLSSYFPNISQNEKEEYLDLALKLNSTAWIEVLSEVTDQADVMIAKHNKDTLEVAIKKGDLDTVKKCLNAGINSLQDYGVHLAAELGKKDILQLLIFRRPILLNLNDIDGYTPLQLAASYGHLDCVQFLVDQAAKLEEGTNFVHRTAIFLASTKEIVLYLLSKGVLQSSFSGDLIFDLMSKDLFSESEIEDLLKKYPSLLKAKSKCSKDPLQYAKDNGKDKWVKAISKVQ